MDQEQFHADVIASLARLETNMKSLVGNGQPGRVTQLEEAVESLNRWKWIVAGVIITISALVHFIFKY